MRSLRELDSPDLVIEVTTTSTALGKAARRLQTETYRDAGLFQGDEPFAFDTDGLLTDAWADDARVFVAVRQGAVVGTARLLQPRCARLPAFAHTDARCPRVEALEEVSGFAVARNARRRGVAIHLIRSMWQDALLRGVEDFVAVVEPSLYRYLTGLYRFDWRLVGKPHVYRSATLLPVAFRVNAPGDTMAPPVQRFMKCGLPVHVAAAFDDRMRLAATSLR
jgi:N-acyl-L-homoserine lactone synthetase